MGVPEVPASLRSWMSAVSEVVHSVNAAEPLGKVLTRVAAQVRPGREPCASDQHRGVIPGMVHMARDHGQRQHRTRAARWRDTSRGHARRAEGAAKTGRSP